mmetsp:Transcript_41657/g.134676  ORF Transcript_41657/g.134676 Transcript_41657/m.134676 type:complete len:298 (-) Transcript_41657:568-1461(-)
MKAFNPCKVSVTKRSGFVPATLFRKQVSAFAAGSNNSNIDCNLAGSRRGTAASNCANTGNISATKDGAPSSMTKSSSISATSSSTPRAICLSLSTPSMKAFRAKRSKIWQPSSSETARRLKPETNGAAIGAERRVPSRYATSVCPSREASESRTERKTFKTCSGPPKRAPTPSTEISRMPMSRGCCKAGSLRRSMTTNSIISMMRPRIAPNSTQILGDTLAVARSTFNTVVAGPLAFFASSELGGEPRTGARICSKMPSQRPAAGAATSNANVSCNAARLRKPLLHRNNFTLVRVPW